MARDKDKQQRIMRIVAERLQIPPDQIADRLSFLEDLDIDSLDMQELMLDLEEEFADD